MNRLHRAAAAVFLAAFPSCLRAQPSPQPAETLPFPTIVVTGRGETTAKPDRATVRVGAASQANDAATAQQQVSQVVTKTIEQIRALGIPEAAIQTRGIDLSPFYFPARPEDTEPRIAGYRASNTIQIRVDDLAKVGPVIDAAVGAGANQVHGVSFELKDELPPRLTALSKAAQQARTKAQAIAAAMNVGLGPVQEIIEEGATAVPFQYAAPARVALEGMQTPVQPGELTVEASLTVRFRIGR